tara:strand:+ start:219 stop:839 length:621 start_codon:yes stop_codon:yes gene_type:complete
MILIACEESQTICKAFRELGLEAYSCDIQDCSGGYPQWHIKGDAIKEAYSGKYKMMIAHPPCTYLSNAGARWIYNDGVKKNGIDPIRKKKREEAISFFLQLWRAPIQYIALENPISLRGLLPEYTQQVQPYQFGHPYSKATRLWLKNLPDLKYTNVLNSYTPYLPSNTGGKKRGQKATFKNISQKESSKTFTGIAVAMAEQWGLLL